MTKFKNGDKVLVVSKSYGDKLEQCRHYEKLESGKMKYLYVADVDKYSSEELIVVNSEKNTFNGSFYKEKDLVLYKKPSKKDKKIEELELIIKEQSDVISELKENVEKSNVIIFEGEDYVKVIRRAKVGDVVVLNDRGTQFFHTNKFYKVFGERSINIKDEKTNTTGELYSMGRTEDNVDVYEKVKTTHQFKVGDKVVPISKHGESLDDSVAWGMRKFDYLFVNHIKEDGTIVCNNEHVDYKDGDYFRKEDLIPYEDDSKENLNSELDEALDKISTLEQKYNKQQEEINELKLEIEELHDNSKVKQKEGVTTSIPEVLLDNVLRKQTIEKAKDFLEVNKDEFGNYRVKDGTEFPLLCNVKFFVDYNKKTVEVVMTGINSGKEYVRKVAKCNNTDVFNEHIGKAIALGRALDLDVSEFENAIQPTVAIGQTTAILYSSTGLPTGEICDVVSIDKDGDPVYGDGMYASDYKIIDDTNAQY